jgi:hypothetical protein
MASKPTKGFIPDDKTESKVKPTAGFVPDVSEVQEQEPETTQLGAIARGTAQGLTFGFADEITAAAESAFGRDYEEALKETREKYKLAEKERPGAYRTAEIGSGLASVFIPGLGAVTGGKAAIAAGKALRSLIQAKRGAELTGKGARAAEAIGTGIAGGALGSIGASEADVLSKQTLESAGQLAADVGTGAVVGGLAGGALQKVVDSETAQKIGKAIGDSKITKSAAELRDRIISGGEKSLEEVQKFIKNPEKVKEVELILRKGVNKKINNQIDAIDNLKKMKGADENVIDAQNQLFKLEEQKLSQEIADVRRKEGINITAEEQAVKQQTSGLKKEYRDVVDSLNEISPKIDDAQISIKNQVTNLSKNLDKQSADSVRNLYNTQLNQIETLSKQRDDFVETALSKIDAEPEDAYALAEALRDMSSQHREEFKTAIVPVFKGILNNEPRFAQLINMFDDPESIEKLGERILTDKFSKADVVKMVENAKKNLFTSDTSTAFGQAKRDAYQILNQKMNSISPEYKEFNTQLNKLMVTREFLETSPLMKIQKVPEIGQEGGQYLKAKAFPVTKRPQISGLDTDFINDLAEKGVDVSLLARQEKALGEQLTTEQLLPLTNLKSELKVKGRALKNQIQDIENKIRLSSGEERLKLQRTLDEKIDKLNLYKDQMTEKLSNARQKLSEKYNAPIESAEEALKQTRRESQEDVAAYKWLEEQPLTTEEAGQLVTIGLSTGSIPFKAGRFFRPSPLSRVKIYNSIQSKFNNPSLSAAVSSRVGQQITAKDIMELANTHKVDPEQLKAALETE